MMTTHAGRRDEGRAETTVSPQRAWLLLAISLVAWLPGLLGTHLIAAAVALTPVAGRTSAYFIPEHALLLYVATPLVVASASLLFLSPGLFLALMLDGARSVGQWVLYGLALSSIVVSAAAGLAQALLGQPLRGSAFALVVVGCALLCWALLFRRVAQGRTLQWPLSQAQAGLTTASMLLVPIGLMAALAPKFYWESFNGDGVHAFESARLLLHQPLPFWPSSAGQIASFPGVTSMLFVFPVSWFVRLFGEVEAAARLPYLLFLVAAYGGVLAVIDHQQEHPLWPLGRLLLWLPLVIYTLAMAFSATYSPYLADIALPATQDTLQIACFLGFALAFLQRKWGWLVLFVALNYTSQSSGLLLIGLWLAATALVVRPRPWRWIAGTAAVLVVCIVLAGLAAPLLVTLGHPPPGGEYGLAGLLRRLAFLQFTDWRRLLFLVIPVGIAPAVALLLWQRQDQVSRVFTAVTAAYFAFFYVQAHISLHHFAPVMVLPLVVYWRRAETRAPARRLPLATITAVAGLLALVLSLPADARPHLAAREIGLSLENRLPGYEQSDPAVFRSAAITTHLFPYTWDPAVPLESYGESPLIWNYYAHRRGNDAPPPNYVVQPAAAPPPASMIRLAAEDDLALYVADVGLWREQRAIRPSAPVGSPVYAIDRGILFRSVTLTGGPTIINVVQTLDDLGFNTDPLLERLGVRR